MDLTKVYYDSGGCSGNILQVVKREPEWASNRIQVGERVIDAALSMIKAMEPFWNEGMGDNYHLATEYKALLAALKGV